MVLGGIEVAGAEQNGKQRQDQGHDQGRVLDPGAGGIGAGTDQQVDPQHNALELQGDIRQHPHQADQRDHNGQ